MAPAARTAVNADALPDPFAWVGDHIGVGLGHGARALFTTRRGGHSHAPFDSLNLGRWTDDDAGAVERNRGAVAGLVGLPLERFAQARQVHGAVVRRVHDVPVGLQDADGIATALEDVAAIVLTADCLPIALAMPGAVAMVHAGWRGLAGGVIDAGVRALRDVARDPDGPITAAIGPGAGGCCYEVGDEVREALGADPCGAPAPIDLKRFACERLYDCDVDAVHDVGLCTMCTPADLFFSHRRDGPATGRQGGIAWRLSS
jgi:YfiH family protein